MRVQANRNPTSSPNSRRRAATTLRLPLPLPLPLRLPIAIGILVTLGAACGSSSSNRSAYNPAPVAVAPAGGYGADTSESAVSRFLDAAAAENYSGMWAVFGTSQGAAIERFGVAETESRMVVLSRLLRHRSYEMRVSNLAGLGPNRVRYEVRMNGTRKGDVMVPVVTVPDADGRWYVEQLEADRLSGG